MALPSLGRSFHNGKFWRLHVPIRGHVFEGLAELAGLSWLERCAVQRRGVDVRLARGDDHQSLRVFLGHLAEGVVEGSLEKRAVYCLAAVIGDLAFDVSNLLTG